jgi:hypothetical protein
VPRWPASRRARRAARDDVRERRLEEISELAERLLYDLGRLIAGHKVDIESYTVPEVSSAIRASLRPFLVAGLILRPDFGIHAELRVEGQLLKADSPIEATVRFEDRSLRETAAGRLEPVVRRPIRIWMRLSLDPPRIRSLQVTPAGG